MIINKKVRFILVLFLSLSQLGKAQIGTVISNKGNEFEIKKNINIFEDVLVNLDENFIDEINPGKLTKIGIDAILNSLDPYTKYYSEKDQEDFRFQTVGNYKGIGIRYSKIPEAGIVITDILKNSPAQKSLLQIGDTISNINDLKLNEYKFDEIEELFKRINTDDITLTITSRYTREHRIIKMIKSTVNDEAVSFAGFMPTQPNIAIVKLERFIKYCARDVRKNFDSLLKVNPNTNGFILDLRSNPGGLLDEAVEIVNLFIPANKMVVYTKGKNKEYCQDYKTRNPIAYDKMKLVVLIDSHSASASEIVAGALQDYDRAVIIGEKSYGKGLVQNIKPLAFNSNFKFTSAKYYIPSGRCIQALDYSRRDENGTPLLSVTYADSTFQSINGRRFMHGQGIQPDIDVVKKIIPKILLDLQTENCYFKFICQDKKLNEMSTSFENFKLEDDDFNRFMSWLNKDGSYQNIGKMKSWKVFYNTIDSSSNLNYDFKTLVNKIIQADLSTILLNQELIKHQLLIEICKTIYYDKNIYTKLFNQNDEFIMNGFKIINSKNKYESILK